MPQHKPPPKGGRDIFLTDEKKRGTQPLMNWTRENMGDEYDAQRNIASDPVGLVKAAANTTARLRAAQATGGKMYDFEPKKKKSLTKAFKPKED